MLGTPAQCAPACRTLNELDDAITHCRACPRLVQWREEIARTKRAAFADQDYWGRPVPGFGPPDARIVVLGLAPAAHGGNRTGRVFTGDRSGDWLFAALFRAGLANQPTSVSIDDGLTLFDTRVLASVRCAPPENKPTPLERDTCASWLHAELSLLKSARVVVVLGAFGWGTVWPALSALGFAVPKPRAKFGHGVVVHVPSTQGRDSITVIGCYHVSQQNTFTGKLTEPMLDEVFATAKTHRGG
ncbi:MAG: uracil-DNA glycosylase [Corynebacteriales bacterium]|nr:uracil-DNA glycosylase [Mycobacteriales bacterium]